MGIWVWGSSGSMMRMRVNICMDTRMDEDMVDVCMEGGILVELGIGRTMMMTKPLSSRIVRMRGCDVVEEGREGKMRKGIRLDRLLRLYPLLMSCMGYTISVNSSNGGKGEDR
jgi:hypothetical protein